MNFNVSSDHHGDQHLDSSMLILLLRCFVLLETLEIYIISLADDERGKD